MCVPASHYLRNVCLQCIVQVQRSLDLLHAVLASDQPSLQSAVVCNLIYITLQIS
jgi:hypothetical protein